jgi:hypothetical protein
MLLALLVLAAGLVVRQARLRSLRLPGYRLTQADLCFMDLHPALDPLLGEALQRPGLLAFDVSVFDDRAEERIREAVARHPMVASVRHVRIRYPDRVEVRVALREPAAWFEARRKDGSLGLLLVSTDGRLLDPLDYATYRDRLRVPLPRVRGVRARPPALIGQAWVDLAEQVVEGIAASRVAGRLYQDFNGTVSVDGIDVSRFPAPPERRREGEVRFTLHDGTVVEWGRTDRDTAAVAGEDPYETKRWRLETELSRRASRRGGRIDVRFRLPGEGRSVAP